MKGHKDLDENILSERAPRAMIIINNSIIMTIFDITMMAIIFFFFLLFYKFIDFPLHYSKQHTKSYTNHTFCITNILNDDNNNYELINQYINK